MSLRTEKYYPWAIAALTTFGYAIARFVFGLDLLGDLKGAAEATLVFSGLLLGFLSTSKSILFALPDRPFVQKVQNAGGFEKLIDYLMSTIRHCLSAAGVSFFYLVLNKNLLGPIDGLVVTAWVFSIALSALSFYRVATRTSKLLRIVLGADRDRFA